MIKKQALHLQFKRAELLTEIEAMKALAYHIVKMKQADLDVAREVAIGKLKAAPVFQKTVYECIQMYGGMGFMNEMLISR